MRSQTHDYKASAHAFQHSGVTRQLNLAAPSSDELNPQHLVPPVAAMNAQSHEFSLLRILIDE
jgi:hypothetical protein